MATVEEIKGLLDQQKADIVAEITQKIDVVEGKLLGVIATVDDHVIQLGDHETRIKQLEDDLKKAIEKQEDIVNRSLRNNLVIKGLDGDEKTWDETRVKVAALLRQMDGEKRDSQFYQGIIERAHRQGKREDGKSRTIYARLFSSEDVKYFVKIARLLRVKDRRFGVVVDHQYSEALQQRRNLAMLKRRELVDGGEFSKVFVDFPVKLMVKKEDWPRYKMHLEF